MLLLAAAHETGLVTTLCAAIPIDPATTHPWLGRLRRSTLQALVLTLLFLCAVGLRRTWDLRSYTGSMLAFLTGRALAYGYQHVERFLSLVAQLGGAEPLTDALARWTMHLWHARDSPVAPARTVYVDGHRKPVYTDHRIPRGLIGRSGKVAGSRAVSLLHDSDGHPLLAITHRGDQHLTRGLPQIVQRYEQATDSHSITQIIVDRECNGAAFLRGQVDEGRTVVTLLRDDQYRGLDDFADLGPFEPLTWDRDGTVVREVAPARFKLALPDHPGETLMLSVALIRDLHWRVPCAPIHDKSAPVPRWDADLGQDMVAWWEAGWEAPPAPVGPTQPKLIPIVSTAATRDAVALAQLYMKRWPRQENIIRDYLLPLGLDVNHGYAHTEVENSEVATQRTALIQRLETLKRWAEGARNRAAQASKRYHKRQQQAHARVDALNRELFQQQVELEAQGCDAYQLRHKMKELKAPMEEEIEALHAKTWRAYYESSDEFRKQERYCRQQREMLRALEDLTLHEQTMYELNNDKDQCMTVCKIALTNLVMWTRDHFFPDTYAHATWQRLAPFFQLKGRITWKCDQVCVEYHPFNDRPLNRDLAVLCTRVEAAHPYLPDGRRLVVTLCPEHRLIPEVYQRC